MLKYQPFWALKLVIYWISVIFDWLFLSLVCPCLSPVANQGRCGILQIGIKLYPYV